MPSTNDKNKPKKTDILKKKTHLHAKARKRRNESITMWLLMQYNVYSIEKIQRLYNDARGQCSNAKQKTCRIPHSNKYLVPQEKLRWLKNDQKRVKNWHSTKNEMVTNNHMNSDNNNKNSNSWLWIYENHAKKSYMWTEDKEGEYGSDLRRKG